MHSFENYLLLIHILLSTCSFACFRVMHCLMKLCHKGMIVLKTVIQSLLTLKIHSLSMTRWKATQLSKSQRLEELLSVEPLIPFSSFKSLHSVKYLSKLSKRSPSLSSSLNDPLYTPNASRQKRPPPGKHFVLFNNTSSFS